MKSVTEHEFNAIRHLCDNGTKDAVRRAFQLCREHMTDILAADSYESYKAKREPAGETDSLSRTEISTIMEAMVALLNSQKKIFETLEDLMKEVQLTNIK